MKQYISPSQLNELSEEQKERLREWWKPEIGDMFACSNEMLSASNYIGPLGPIVTHVFVRGDEASFMAGQGIGEPEEFDKKNCLPCLSIGQMIEILGCRIYFIMPDYCKKWLVRSFKGCDTEAVDFDDIVADELADALWQAVKEVL